MLNQVRVMHHPFADPISITDDTTYALEDYTYLEAIDTFSYAASGCSSVGFNAGDGWSGAWSSTSAPYVEARADWELFIAIDPYAGAIYRSALGNTRPNSYYLTRGSVDGSGWNDFAILTEWDDIVVAKDDFEDITSADPLLFEPFTGTGWSTKWAITDADTGTSSYVQAVESWEDYPLQTWTIDCDIANEYVCTNTFNSGIGFLGQWYINAVVRKGGYDVNQGHDFPNLNQWMLNICSGVKANGDPVCGEGNEGGKK